MEVLFRLVRKSSHVVKTRGAAVVLLSKPQFNMYVYRVSCVLLSVSISGVHFSHESTV